MKKTKVVVMNAILSTIAIVLVVMPVNAYAYIDPAATSYLAQIVVGIVVACGVFIGIFKAKIKAFFVGLKMKALEKKLNKQNTQED